MGNYLISNSSLFEQWRRANVGVDPQFLRERPRRTACCASAPSGDVGNRAGDRMRRMGRKSRQLRAGSALSILWKRGLGLT